MLSWLPSLCILNKARFMPLHAAFMCNQFKAALCVIHQDSRPQHQRVYGGRPNGQIPLAIASKRGMKAVVKALVAKGTDGAARDADGATLAVAAAFIHSFIYSSIHLFIHLIHSFIHL